MLPPYETRATLDRLAQDLAATRPATVVALGDSFDDLAAADALDLEDRATLAALHGGPPLGLDRGQPRGRPHAHGGEHHAELPLGGPHLPPRGGARGRARARSRATSTPSTASPASASAAPASCSTPGAW